MKPMALIGLVVVAGATFFCVNVMPELSELQTVTDIPNMKEEMGFQIKTESYSSATGVRLAQSNKLSSLPEEPIEEIFLKAENADIVHNEKEIKVDAKPSSITGLELHESYIQYVQDLFQEMKGSFVGNVANWWHVSFSASAFLIHRSSNVQEGQKQMVSHLALHQKHSVI